MKARPIALAVALLLSGLFTAGLIWNKLEIAALDAAARRAEEEVGPVAIRVSSGTMIAINVAHWFDRFWFVLWPLGVGLCFGVTFGLASFFHRIKGEQAKIPEGKPPDEEGPTRGK